MYKNNFRKIDLIKDLSKKKGLSNNLAKKIINDFILIIINNIKTGNLNLKNIGSFKIIKKNKRIGRNPKTKEEFIISSRKAIQFSASKKIKNIFEEIL